MKLSIKITTLLLFCLLISAKSFAQRISLSESKAPLEKVLNEIKLQSGYLFFYNQDWMAKSKPVTVNVKKVTLEQALRATFANQPFTYDIVDKTISLKIKDVAKPTSGTGKKFSILVRGAVLDTLNKPISGATVKLRGTSQITLTDQSGRFTLSNVDPDGILDITNIGYALKSVKPSQTPLLIYMQYAVSQLDAVQVTAYGKTSQRLSTGSQTTITAAQLAISPAPNILEAMQGLVPGMTITQRGSNASSNYAITLRGMNSLTTTADPTNASVPYLNSPLILLDGFPLAGSTNSSQGILPIGASNSANLADNGMSILYTLNPADVESVTVLKDAAATSIYGSRGANGVILITTKRAKGGKLNVTASAGYGLNAPSNKLKLMNTQQYLAMRREAYQYDVNLGQAAPPDANTAPDLVTWDPNRDIDWQKLLLGSKPFYNAQFSISGGTGLTTLLVNGSYNDSFAGYSGVPSNLVSQYKETRTTFSAASTTQTADNRFIINTHILVSSANSFLPASDLSSLIYMAPNAPDLFAGGQPNYAGWTTPNGQSNLPTAAADMVNPTSTLFTSINAGADLSYEIIKQLTLRVTGSYSNTDGNAYQVSSSSASTAPSERATYASIGLLRYSNFENSLANNWSTEANLSYTKQIGKHQFNILSGISFQKASQSATNITAFGYASDLLERTPTGGTSYTSGNNTVDMSKLASVYGLAGYNYGDKYLVNLSARRDGSSTFGANRQWGTFASVSGAWIFSLEDWMKALTANKLFSFGKVRASYGTTGNAVGTNYQYLANYTTAGNNSYEGLAGLALARIANPNIQWSDVTKLDGGLDIGFLNDKLTLSGDYYRNTTTNMLLNGATTAVVGSTNVVANFPGVVQNRGFEGTLSYRSNPKKAVTWMSSINIAFNRNILVSFPNIGLLAGYSSTYQVGQSIDRILLPVGGGVNPATGAVTTPAITAYSGTQDVSTIFYNTLPAFSGGFQEQVAYKGFSLSIYFDYAKQYGLQGLITNTGLAPGAFNANQLAGVFNSRWQKPGDITNIPAFTTFNPLATTDYYNSAAFYGDISFIHLSNARLSYTLPPSVLRRLQLTNIGLFVSGSNLLYFSKYKGLNPQRMLLTSGLNVTF